jgi:hypothetical protein
VLRTTDRHAVGGGNANNGAHSNGNNNGNNSNNNSNNNGDGELSGKSIDVPCIHALQAIAASSASS